MPFSTLAAGALTPQEITTFLLSLAVLLGAARLLGELAKKAGQPMVLGEILAGVLLGATVLANISPGAYKHLFPEKLVDQNTGQTVHHPAVDDDGQVQYETTVDPETNQTVLTPVQGEPAPSLVKVGLETFSVLCVCLLLLLAGLEVDLSVATKQGKAAIWVSLLGMIAPFVLGAGVSLLVPKLLGYDPSSDNPTAFALFMGIAMSITALPVIAKILMDLNLFRSDLGMLIMSSAMVNDLLGWIGFALVLALIIPPEESAVPLHFVIPATLVFVAFMLTGGRYLMNKCIPFVQAHFSWPGGILGFVFVVALLCAALTEWIGIHAIFGAFLAGVAIGDSKHLKPKTRQTIEDIIAYVFAPIFFASVALRVDFVADFDLLSTVIVLVVAIAGKTLGCYAAAKWSGYEKRQAWAIGFGMSARGAMEIILGQIALNYGLITNELFVAIVIMAIVTSLIAGPAMQWALQRKQHRSLQALLSSKHHVGRLSANTRKQAIEEMAAFAAQAIKTDGLDAATIAQAVWQREELMSTGAGDGIAVPHARLEGLKQPAIFVGISPAGLDFDAPDGQAAEIVFLILSPANNTMAQIEALQAIAKSFAKQNDRRRAVVESENFTEFKAALATTQARAH